MGNGMEFCRGGGGVGGGGGRTEWKAFWMDLGKGFCVCVVGEQ